jgi:hypothetical protein
MSSTESKSMRELLASPVVRQDVHLVVLLVVMGVAALPGAWLLTILPLAHRAIYYGFGIYVIHVPVLVFGLWRLNRHNYSDAAGVTFLIGVLAWAFWNQLIWLLGILSGWLSDPQPAYHIVITAVVGLLPLFFVIWKLGRKLRKAS